MSAFGVLPSWVKVMNAGGKLTGLLLAPLMRRAAAHAATDPRTDQAIPSGRERAAVPTPKALRDVDADVRLTAMQVLHDLGTATSVQDLPGELFTECDPDPTIRSGALDVVATLAGSDPREAGRRHSPRLLLEERLRATTDPSVSGPAVGADGARWAMQRPAKRPAPPPTAWKGGERDEALLGRLRWR